MYLNLKIERNVLSSSTTKVSNKTYRNIEEFSIESESNKNTSTLKFILTKEHYDPTPKRTFASSVNIHIGNTTRDRFPNTSSSVTEVFDNLTKDGAKSIKSFIHNSGYDKYYHIKETDRSLTISYKYEDTNAYSKAIKSKEELKEQIKTIQKKYDDYFFAPSMEFKDQDVLRKYQDQIKSLQDELWNSKRIDKVYKYKYLVVPKSGYKDTTSPTSKHLDDMNKLSSKRSTETIENFTNATNSTKSSNVTIAERIASKILDWF